MRTKEEMREYQRARREKLRGGGSVEKIELSATPVVLKTQEPPRKCIECVKLGLRISDLEKENRFLLERIDCFNRVAPSFKNSRPSELYGA
jgi:hypothetical protein